MTKTKSRGGLTYRTPKIYIYLHTVTQFLGDNSNFGTKNLNSRPKIPYLFPPSAGEGGGLTKLWPLRSGLGVNPPKTHV
jgi:hypothetical protein